MYVGRNTSNGSRDFYFSAANAVNWVNRVSRIMQGLGVGVLIQAPALPEQGRGARCY